VLISFWFSFTFDSIEFVFMEKPLIVKNDPWLEPYSGTIEYRQMQAIQREKELLNGMNSLRDFASGYLYFGMHFHQNKWVFREWAPHASRILLIGDFNNWSESEAFELYRIENGCWEIVLPADQLSHEQLYKLKVYWEGGAGERIPSYARRVVQDTGTNIFSAQVWAPDQPYQWKFPTPVKRETFPLIYESHVGMATEDERVGTYVEFRDRILPRIKTAGYNYVQLMAVQEHPYYGSFGYHVSNFFSPSSRFGTPEELKSLIDTAHEMGMGVIMDIVHSHSVKNEIEGLARFDGTPFQYFHDGPRREHTAWDSLCFDYGKHEVIHFLLSNIKYWMEEFKFDGFRFDGVTSMLYYDHGLGRDYTSYDYYFDGQQDDDAITYLMLANKLAHEVNPLSVTIAEEVSGMPGLAAPIEAGGYGFDYRMAMGVPDFWIRQLKEKSDENWNMTEIYHELTSRRADERTVNYAESHDQALVGDKTIIFWLIDKEMYWHMNIDSQSLIVDRGIALHKMIRLFTAATAGGAYLNFMGNEFGHPEWIDFPREGNNWSYKYARRQWSLVDNENLRYMHLAVFDREMIHLIKEKNLLNNPYCYIMHENVDDQVIAFKRGDIYFVFNFSPTRSYTDYGLNAEAGKYRLLLHTDEPRFGGFDRIDSNMMYFAEKQGRLTSSAPVQLKVYLPGRTALVFERMPTPSVRGRARRT
jgi:1,4-alpha-glucan branching enzyme